MTVSFKNQSAQRPTAMGTLLQNSAYGSTIPVIYGQTQSVLLAIWAANLRQGGGGIKKFKKAVVFKSIMLTVVIPVPHWA